MTDGTMPDPAPALTEAAERVSDMLDRLLAHPGEDRIERRLFECMRYACLGPGKRLRPFLVLHSSSLFGVSPSAALRVAAAVEMVHAYSLVHDDLPAMDDDDLRRGRPSAHRAYDEATAILAGDGLLTYAFDVLASEATHSDPRVIVDLISTLARAAGPHGMVGGQMMDLEAENRLLDQVQITRLHRLKTGRMFALSCEAGAILGKAPRAMRHALAAYAHDIGLAFQIKDDLLDIEGTSADIGKTAGKDAERGKATFVRLLGTDQAREQMKVLADQAVDHLGAFDAQADSLRAVAAFVIDRAR